jgi:hypothetical protein
MFVDHIASVPAATHMFPDPAGPCSEAAEAIIALCSVCLWWLANYTLNKQQHRYCIEDCSGGCWSGYILARSN